MRAKQSAIVILVMAILAIGCQSTQSKSDTPADSTTALQSQLDAMRPGDSLKLDAKPYAHGGVLYLRVPRVQIDGNGATLQATNDATSAVQIQADGVQLSNLRLTAPAQGPRMTGLEQHKLVVAGSGDTISNVTIDGSAAAGIFVNGARDFTIRNVDVSNTRADGVHMTQGAGPGVVDGVRTSQTGDDAVAVVSYQDSKPVHDITISNVDVAGTRWGRGISVVGGSNVDVSNFNVAATNAAGLYIATEGSPYFTLPVDGVRVSKGSIRQANQNPDVVHGAILIVAADTGAGIRNVSISDVDIAATSPTAGRDVAIVDDGGSIGQVALSRIHIADDALPPFVAQADPADYRLDEWTVGGKIVRVG